MTPIEKLMEGVAWEVVQQVQANSSDMPFATHAGILNLFGNDLRVYRLSTGQAIINADDLHALFGDALNDSATDELSMAAPDDVPEHSTVCTKEDSGPASRSGG
jgi:hypothetical protein